MLFSRTPPRGIDPVSRVGVMKQIAQHSQIVAVNSVAERAAVLSTLSGQGFTPSPTDPVWVHRLDLGTIEVTTDGTTWKIFRSASYGMQMADGYAWLEFSNSITTFASITYPEGRFTSTPRVLATLNTIGLGITLGSGNETPTGARIFGTAGGPYSGEVGVHWIAVASTT